MKVLVLNASFEPLNICEWERAVVLILKGKAEHVEHNGKLLRPNFPLPIVIRLVRYVRVPYMTLGLSKENILHRDNHTCQYCGGRATTVDHIIPRSRRGKSTWDNMVGACEACNMRKGDRTPQQAGMLLLRAPRHPPSRIAFEISKYPHLQKWWLSSRTV